MKSKVQALLIALVLLALPAVVRAQYIYTTNNGAITITGYTGPGGAVTIPDTINGYPVTSIGEGALSYIYSLTSVTIGNNVTNIGVGAFYDCSLRSVIIGSSVTSIPEYAFGDNNGLTNVTINGNINDFADTAIWHSAFLTSLTLGSNVTNIDNINFLFMNTSNINVNVANPVYSSLNGVLFNKTKTTLIRFPAGQGGSYVIPNSVLSLAPGAFEQVYYLESLTIGAGVTNLSGAAFNNCIGLTNLIVNPGNLNYSSLNHVLFNKSQTILIRFPAAFGGGYIIPDSVTNIGDSAFESCSMTQVTIPNSVINIGTNAFFGCSATNVVFGNGIADIGNYAFYRCNLTTLTLPDSVTSIGDYAFSYSGALTDMTIGSGVVYIGKQALSSCWSLTNINVRAANLAFSSSNGVLFDKAQTTLIQFPVGRVDGYVIPDTVMNIEDNAFNESGLTSVVIGKSVASIGTNAFSNCYFLTTITIPAGVTSLGAQAFESCYGLISIYFLGDAPPDDGTVFYAANTGNNFVYYLPGTTGWNSTFGGIPTVLWNPHAQSAHVTGGKFGFGITGPANTDIVVEACTNLANPVWLTVSTNTLSNSGASAFSDPQSGNYPNRYYRFRSP